MYGLFLPLQQAYCKDVHMLMIYGQGTTGAVAFLCIGPHASGKGAFGVASMLHQGF